VQCGDWHFVFPSSLAHANEIRFEIGKLLVFWQTFLWCIRLRHPKRPSDGLLILPFIPTKRDQLLGPFAFEMLPLSVLEPGRI
jgi:hypothetical protein